MRIRCNVAWLLNGVSKRPSSRLQSPLSPVSDLYLPHVPLPRDHGNLVLQILENVMPMASLVFLQTENLSAFKRLGGEFCSCSSLLNPRSKTILNKFQRHMNEMGRQIRSFLAAQHIGFFYASGRITRTSVRDAWQAECRTQVAPPEVLDVIVDLRHSTFGTICSIQTESDSVVFLSSTNPYRAPELIQCPLQTSFPVKNRTLTSSSTLVVLRSNVVKTDSLG